MRARAQGTPGKRSAAKGIKAARAVLVTGANRGLGLALARHYASMGFRVYACCRRPARASALKEFAGTAPGKVSLHRLDVASAASVGRLARSLRGKALDLLINNAGIYGGRLPLQEIDYVLWRKACEVNLLGPVRLSAAFARALGKRRGLIVNISTIMASVALTDEAGSYAYRSTKAGLNMVSKTLANELKPSGVSVVAIHPGWVRTDMGGPRAPLSPDESAAKVAAVIAKLSLSDSGKFLNYRGETMPW